MLCRHHGADRGLAGRRVGLTCYIDPLFRQPYPLVLGGILCLGPDVDDFTGPAEFPDSPTDSWPGSAEKIAVLAERAELQQTLWHPDDGKGRSTA